VDTFSYLSVLLSIIIGIGMSQILTTMGRLIQQRDAVRFYWPPLLWAGMLLLIYVQSWWAMFGLRTHTEWRFLEFVIVLLQTITLYMMAAVVLPDQIEESGVDLRVHYEKHQRWLFGFLLATLLVSVLKDVILGGRLPERANLGFHVFLALSAISAMVVRRVRYHEFLAVLTPVAMVAYIAALFARLT
jgi:hypothetical protein